MVKLFHAQFLSIVEQIVRLILAEDKVLSLGNREHSRQWQKR